MGVGLGRQEGKGRRQRKDLFAFFSSINFVVMVFRAHFLVVTVTVLVIQGGGGWGGNSLLFSILLSPNNILVSFDHSSIPFIHSVSLSLSNDEKPCNTCSSQPSLCIFGLWHCDDYIQKHLHGNRPKISSPAVSGEGREAGLHTCGKHALAFQSPVTVTD